MHRLCNPVPDLLDEVLGHLLGPNLGVEGGLAGPDVCVLGLDECGTLEDLPEGIEGKVDGDADISGDEVLDGPVSGCEDIEAVEDDDDGEVGEGEVCGVGLEPGAEDQVLAVNSLSDQGLAELDEGDADGHPCEEVGNGGEVLEPAEDIGCTAGHGHESDEGDGGSHHDGVVWDTGTGALEEELRGLLVLRQGEEVTRTGVEEGVGRGRGGSQDDGVDDGREDRDTSAVDGDNPRRVSGTNTTVEEVASVARDTDTNGQRTENVEEEDTPEDTTNGLGNVLPWVLGLTGSDSNHLDTTVGESGVDKSGEETKEATGVASADVLLHGARVLPVTETETVVRWSSTKVNDESADQKTENGDDLDTGKNEFGFTINGDGEDVETDDDDDDD